MINNKHIISESPFVECRICKRLIEIIDGKHLKYHKINLDEYQERFPNEPTITKAKCEKEIERYKKISEINKSGRTKKVKCYHCPEIIEVDSNASNNESVCKKCYDKGLRSPSMIQRKENVEKTLAEKYDGVTNPALIEGMGKIISQRKKEKFKDEEYKNSVNKKREDTMQNEFNVKNIMDLPEYRDKAIEVRMENYDKDDHIKKTRATKLERYGNETYFNVEKFKETKLEKFGNENFVNPEKSKGTKLEKYGDENYNNINQTKITNVERYGFENVGQSPVIKEKIQRTKSKNFFSSVIPKILEAMNLELLEEYRYGSALDKYKFRCKNNNCNFEFTQIWNEIQGGFRCPNCVPRKKGGPSVAELEVREFIQGLGFDIMSGNQVFIAPWELDIIIHSEKIAFEYNGLWYHNEQILTETRKVNGRQYHLNKLNLTNEKGYKLITIFEDEWINKREIVEQRIKQILHKNDSIKINGRDCIIKEITPQLKNEFLNKFHIQGPDSSVIKLGAFYNNELVSVMTFSHGNISKGSRSIEGIWELNRFCSDSKYHVRGIASKLLDHFKNNYEWSEIFSYADRRWSDGNLYYQLGFDLELITQPNYWYIKGIKRIHRWELRKRPDEPKDVPEIYLRTLEGYNRIWDCGNLKFRLKK